MAARRGPQEIRTGDGGVELVDRDAVDRDRDGDILWRARKRVSARYGHACSRERGTYVEEVRPRLDIDVEAEVVEQDLDAALQLLLAGAELVLWRARKDQHGSSTTTTRRKRTGVSWYGSSVKPFEAQVVALETLVQSRAATLEASAKSTRSATTAAFIA